MNKIVTTTVVFLFHWSWQYFRGLLCRPRRRRAKS